MIRVSRTRRQMYHMYFMQSGRTGGFFTPLLFLFVTSPPMSRMAGGKVCR